MLNIKTFPFNPFAMNTYVLWDETHEGIIIDAGNNTNDENRILLDFISENQINIIGLFLTHNHIDHIMGVKFLSDNFNLPIQTHAAGDFLFNVAEPSAKAYGMHFAGLPDSKIYIEDGAVFKLGNHSFQAIYTPGHADGSLCYYFSEAKIIVVGDVIFNGGIGRTDLPTGDYDVLEMSIRNKLYTLDDEVVVYPGHGPETTIGFEKRNNPFFQA